MKTVDDLAMFEQWRPQQRQRGNAQRTPFQQAVTVAWAKGLPGFPRRRRRGRPANLEISIQFRVPQRWRRLPQYSPTLESLRSRQRYSDTRARANWTPATFLSVSSTAIGRPLRSSLHVFNQTPCNHFSTQGESKSCGMSSLQLRGADPIRTPVKNKQHHEVRLRNDVPDIIVPSCVYGGAMSWGHFQVNLATLKRPVHRRPNGSCRSRSCRPPTEAVAQAPTGHFAAPSPASLVQVGW